MCSKRKLEEEIRHAQRTLDCIHEDIKRVLRWIALKKVDFTQSGGCDMADNFSIQAGSSGSFTGVLNPANGTQKDGTVPTWVSSDPTVQLTISSDGLKCTAAVPASDTAASFDLQFSATSSDPTVGTNGVVSATHTVTVTQPGPPPPPPPTALQSVDFTQDAPTV